ncbi:hypothetical protein [Robiginitalea sp. SC105]|uniref:hypothetical protein n=1 Tax=Robiginitalea sp. SC105 TaxID=2762332 RepID=UPI001C8DA446
MELDCIGLPLARSRELAGQLNQLPANFQAYYRNLRGIHWNIRGKSHPTGWLFYAVYC